jgi:nicotinamide-nucleotide amidase
MTVESIAIGDEILRGEVVDSNSAYLGAALLQAGLRLARAHALADEIDEIAGALRAAAERAHAVVVSGGLGPTADDRTAEAAALAFGRPLALHAPTLDRIRSIFAARGYPLTPNNEKQALVPEGAEVIENPKGTAPAFALKAGGCELFFLPGVPREYRPLVDRQVVPRIALRRGGAAVRSRVLHTLGATESRVDQLLRDFPVPGVRLSFRVEGPETHVILLCEGEASEAEARLAEAEGAAALRLGALLYGRDRETLAGRLGDELVRRGWRLAIAESCTGGLVSAAVTDVPGSSRYFETGIVAYANETKIRLLRVPAEVIEEHGAVSEETARAMARGVRAVAGCEVGVGVTGIAGPEGGSPEKPVGLVHFAACGVREVHRQVLLPPGRERVRTFSARIALAVALESLAP